MALPLSAGPLRSLVTRPAAESRVECVAEFDCPPGGETGLSFAYAHGSAAPLGAVYECFAADAGSAASHLRRLKVLDEGIRLVAMDAGQGTVLLLFKRGATLSSVRRRLSG